MNQALLLGTRQRVISTIKVRNQNAFIISEQFSQEFSFSRRFVHKYNFFKACKYPYISFSFFELDLCFISMYKTTRYQFVYKAHVGGTIILCQKRFERMNISKW